VKIIRLNSKEIEKIYNRTLIDRKRIRERVRRILEDVRLFGDEALIKYTRKFDKVKQSSKQLRVSESEISAAYQNISSDFISTLKLVIENINRFYKKQIKKSWKTGNSDGVILGELINPIENIGVYVPAGTAPLFSSVYMSVLPAKLAGVKRIVLVTPPRSNGFVDPHILVVADLLKVNEIYKVGGAQAIAALAFGTKTISRVDKIVGPGNMYVTEAKKQVFGFCDIDMLAGPTELAIIANRFSNPDFVKADILAQTEHAGGLAILITNSKQLARQLKNEIKPGFIIITENLEAAVDVANKIAPEHLEILINNPRRLLKKIKNAGAVFLGPYSPVAVGDYVAGPSHVLPTGGSARFFSGLGLNDFLKSTHVIWYSKKALESVKGALEKIGTAEGLIKHIDSVKARFIEKPNK
jgi:histidinol dehydrogenase